MRTDCCYARRTISVGPISENCDNRWTPKQRLQYCSSISVYWKQAFTCRLALPMIPLLLRLRSSVGRLLWGHVSARTHRRRDTALAGTCEQPWCLGLRALIPLGARTYRLRPPNRLFIRLPDSRLPDKYFVSYLFAGWF